MVEVDIEMLKKDQDLMISKKNCLKDRSTDFKF